VIEVRVPCSTSNLGAGFDCIGLAFRRYLTVRCTPGDLPLQITRSGTLEQLGETAARDAVILGLRAALPAGAVVTGTLDMHSDIPIGRGLGSSAAATVAGIVLANVLTILAAGGTPDDAREVSPAFRMHSLALATDIEGHPDNSAPALFGGLVAVARDGASSLNAFRLPVSTDIGFVFAAPDLSVSTLAARAALPAEVPHALAARMLGRMAALVRGLETADPDLLRIGLTDELHVQHRLPLIPGGAAAIAAARTAGAWGATISGSGSGLLAVGPVSARPTIASAMSEALARAGAPGIGIEMELDMTGVQVRP
jgi:homoserine kinase